MNEISMKTKKERKQEIMKENEWVINGSIRVWIQCDVYTYMNTMSEQGTVIE